MKTPSCIFCRRVVVGTLALILTTIAAGPCGAANNRHHITLALGYQKLLSEDLTRKAIGIDFTNAAFASVGYRLSLLPNVDVTVDSRSTISTHGDAYNVNETLTCSFFGPGIRLIAPNEGVRPYVQANVFLVTEEGKVEAGRYLFYGGTQTGAGFGVSAGVDIRAGRLLSVPIEANYMYGAPSDDVSSLGVNIGLTFNFGRLHR